MSLWGLAWLWHAAMPPSTCCFIHRSFLGPKLRQTLFWVHWWLCLPKHLRLHWLLKYFWQKDLAIMLLKMGTEFCWQNSWVWKCLRQETGQNIKYLSKKEGSTRTSNTDDKPVCRSVFKTWSAEGEVSTEDKRVKVSLIKRSVEGLEERT